MCAEIDYDSQEIEGRQPMSSRRTTAADVLAAVERQNNQHVARYDAIARQMADLAVGQADMARRLVSLETEMQAVKGCVQINTTKIAILDVISTTHGHKLEKVEAYEREGTVGQSKLSATVSLIVSIVMGWVMSRTN